MKDHFERFDRLIGGLNARRRRAALAGAVSTLVLFPLGAWIVLFGLSPLFSAFRYYPFFAFILFWCAAGAAVVLAARVFLLSAGGMIRTASELGESAEKGSLFVSALEFSRGSGRLDNYSGFLVSETVRRAGLDLEKVDPAAVLISSGRPLVTVAAFALGLVALLQVLLGPGLAYDMAAALSDPGISLRGGPASGLISAGRDIDAVSGDDVDVFAFRLGSRKEAVRISWSTVPGIWKSEEVAGDSGYGEKLETFRYTFEDIREDLVFRFESGGEVSAEAAIRVARRPVINRIAAELKFPSYMKRDPERIATLTGRITAPVGTEVSLSGETSSDVASGEIRFASGRSSGLVPVSGGFAGSFRVTAGDTAYVSVTGVNGLESERPSRLPIAALVDRGPEIEILAPADGDLLPRTQRVTVLLRAFDDYGISGVTLYHMMERLGGSWLRVDIPAGGRRMESSFEWSLEDERVSPGDRVLFYLEATDNNTATGPGRTRTETRALRIPTLTELYAESRDRQELQRESMDEILDEGREIRERLADLSEEIRSEGDMDWSRRSEAGELLERQKQLQDKLKEASSRLGETLESLEANRMTSQEVGEKLEEIQSLVGQIESEELRDAMEKLRSMMEQADPDQVAAAMQDIEMSADRLLERLDRTIELLKSLLDQQRVEEMMRRMEEMIAEQRELRDSTLAGGDEETADGQDELGGEFEDFQSGLSEFAAQTDSMRAPGLEEVAEQASSSGVDSLMKSAASDIRSGEMEGAAGCQSEAMNRMLSLYTRLGSCQMGISVSIESAVIEAAERAAVELIETSRLQEEYAASLARASRSNGPETGMIGGQLEIRDAVAAITDRLYDLSRRSLMLSHEIFLELGLAVAAMDEAMEQIESRRMSDAGMIAKEIPHRINLAAIALLESTSSSGSSSGAGQGMQKLMGGQSEIDQGMRDLLGGGREGYSMEDRAAMSRLAAEQRSMDDLLEQILEESGGSQPTLGNISDLGSEMEEVARKLERGELDSELLEREEQILGRLLESQRSLNRRDYSRRRESRSAGDLRALDRGPRRLPAEDREVLLDRIKRAMRERGPAEYEELNRLYFRALSGKARESR